MDPPCPRFALGVPNVGDYADVYLRLIDPATNTLLPPPAIRELFADELAAPKVITYCRSRRWRCTPPATTTSPSTTGRCSRRAPALTTTNLKSPQPRALEHATTS
jgi:hypothetical protein